MYQPEIQTETDYELNETEWDREDTVEVKLTSEEILTKGIEEIIKIANYDTSNPVIAALMAVRQNYITAIISEMEM